MKFCQHITARKISAVLLIALMLFINAVKLFHTDPGSHLPSTISKTDIAFSLAHPDSQQIKQNDRCAICDFQLAKDADVVEIIFYTPPVLQIAPVGLATLPERLTAYHHSASDRAPPAQA